MIKVLHISTAKSWRGGEQQLAYMIENINHSKFSNYLLCISDSEVQDFFKASNVKIYTQRKSHSFSISWGRKINKICQDEQIDIIHCHDSKSHTYAVLSDLIVGRDSPIVVHRKVAFPIKTSYLTKYKYNYKNVKKIICISNAVVDQVNKVVENKSVITLINSSKKIGKTNEHNISLKEKYRLNKKNKIIGYIAALTFEKDHETFLNTAKQIINKRNDVHFFIIGEGKLKHSIEEKITELKLSDYVTVTGFIKDAKLLINQFDLLLFTSISEGLGSTLLDTMEQRVPIVMTKNGGGEEVIIDNYSGFICNKKDYKCLSSKVLLCLEDTEKVAFLTENAYQDLLSKFSVDKMVKLLEDQYLKIIS